MASAIDPVGPYERWMFGPGKTFDLPGILLDHQASLTAVAEFAGPLTTPALTAVTTLLTAGSVTLQPKIPTLYSAPGFAPHFIPVLLCPQDAALNAHTPDSMTTLLAQLTTAASGAGNAIGQIRLNYPIRAETLDPAAPTAAALTADPGFDPHKPLVIIAVIDHGIPFAHHAYRSATSTRIDYCWSHSALTDRTGASLFGREFRRDTINALIADHRGDEDAIYHAAGLMGGPGLPAMPLARMHSHGAHVLATAARNGLTPDANLRIIAVDLPATAIWDTSGFGCDMVLLSALHYIFDRAQKIAAAYNRAEAPLVINLSYGDSGGPHDGSGLLEAAFDEMITHRRQTAPTALILPSGNMFQDGLHAKITPDQFATDPGGASRSAQIIWFEPPHDMTSCFVELWYPPGTDPAAIKVSLTPPPGHGPDPSLSIAAAGCHAMTLGGQIIGQLSLDKYRDQRWRVTIITAPSEPRALPAGYAALPAGPWTIRLEHKVAAPPPGDIAARIQVDTGFGQGHTGARQSSFLDAAYRRFDPQGAPAQTDDTAPVAMMRRFDGLNGMATGSCVMAVAGYVGATGKAARYSSAGPAAASGAAKSVDTSAQTDRSGFNPGVVSAGTRSGVTVALQGTSSAAPQIARQLAAAFLGGAGGATSDNYLNLLAPSPAFAKVDPPGPDPKHTDPTGRDRLGRYRLLPA